MMDQLMQVLAVIETIASVLLLIVSVIQIVFNDNLTNDIRYYKLSKRLRVIQITLLVLIIIITFMIVIFH